MSALSCLILALEDVFFIILCSCWTGWVERKTAELSSFNATVIVALYHISVRFDACSCYSFCHICFSLQSFSLILSVSFSLILFVPFSLSFSISLVFYSVSFSLCLSLCFSICLSICLYLCLFLCLSLSLYGLESFCSKQQKAKTFFFCIEDEGEEFPHKMMQHRTM